MKRIKLALSLLFGKYTIKNNDIINTRTGNVVYIHARKLYFINDGTCADIIKIK